MVQCKVSSYLILGSIELCANFLGIVILWVKRMTERPKRKRKIWSLDASKQFIVSFLSWIIINAATQNEENICAKYFIENIMNVTIGMLVNMVLLRICTEIVKKKLKEQKRRQLQEDVKHLRVSGDYGNPISYKTWLNQLLTWFGIAFSSKIFTFNMVVLLHGPLNKLENAFFGILKDDSTIIFCFVVIISPSICHMVEFWVQDYFLMDRKEMGSSKTGSNKKGYSTHYYEVMKNISYGTEYKCDESGYEESLLDKNQEEEEDEDDDNNNNNNNDDDSKVILEIIF